MSVNDLTPKEINFLLGLMAGAQREYNDVLIYWKKSLTDHTAPEGKCIAEIAKARGRIYDTAQLVKKLSGGENDVV